MDGRRKQVSAMEVAIVEERRESVVTDTAPPILRAAHFLKPSAPSPTDALLPASPLPPSSSPTLELKFPTWEQPGRDWERWVALMEPEHSGTWRKAGIFEAVKASAAGKPAKDVNLILDLARRWSPETNTFVFPWGEATVTLEDVMVTGGYSVLGSSPIPGLAETAEMLEVEKRLHRANSELSRGKCKKALFSRWEEEFMSSGSEIEHEAFLSLFLSRFVFRNRGSWGVINPSSFRVAVPLALGKRIALAPAVLANIYTDLSLLRNRIVSSARGGKLTLRAPLQLVQVWAWERFPDLKVKPQHIRKGAPRISRWVKPKRSKLDTVGLALDSSSRSFQWRPYSEPAEHLVAHGFYSGKKEWTLVKDDSDEELRSFARCLIACKLVGYDQEQTEPYHPHRVARQFGFNQDLPDHVNSRTFEELISNVRLYVPSCRSKPGVTARYLSWWEKFKLVGENADGGRVEFEGTTTSSRPRLGKCLEENELGNDSGCAGLAEEDDPTITELLRSIRKKKGAHRSLAKGGASSCSFSLKKRKEEKVSSSSATMAGEVECIVEEREALVVPPHGRDIKPVSRTACFLKPTSDGSRPLSISPSFFSMQTEFEPSKCPLKVRFCSWKAPSTEWQRWAAQMGLKHGDTWEKAGILEAIRASRHETLIKDPVLLLSLAQRWSPETKTFIFEWGEATVTLEDVMVTGAYPVLGYPVVAPLETDEMERAERQLQQVWSQVSEMQYSKSKGQAVLWIKRFMRSDSEIEHEAFLPLWLSQFVFPQSQTVSPNTFPAAIRLARGKRVALAPAILAAIYRDLSLLKKGIDKFSDDMGNRDRDDGNGTLKLDIWALFQFVQVWAWERFPTVRPKPDLIQDDELGIARWIERKPLKLPNIGKAFDSCEELFQWRPYAHLTETTELRKFHPENGMWVIVDSDTDDELLSFARFLIPCELVGLDECVEQYLPYRVGMQFGMDQDLPCSIAWPHLISKVSWTTFNRPIPSMKVYIPSRLREAGLTTRCARWWTESKVSSGAPTKMNNVGQFKETPGGSEVLIGNNMQKQMEGLQSSVPPGFKQRRDAFKVLDSEHSASPEDPNMFVTTGEVNKNEFGILDSSGFSTPKSSEVLTSNAGDKTKEVDLSFRPCSRRKLNEVQVLEPNDSHEDDRTRIEESPRHECIGPSTDHVESPPSDNSPLITGKSLGLNLQSVMEGEADTEGCIRTDDNEGISSARDVSIAKNTGKNVAEMTVNNLRDRLSRAEEFLMEFLSSSRRAQQD